VIRIEDPKDFRISAYSQLKHKEEVHTHFVADHEKTVIRLLESNWKVESIFGTQAYLEKHRTKIQEKGIPEDKIFTAPESVFLETVGFSIHRGFLALGVVPENQELDQLTSPLVICSELADAENLGSILRTSAAFGIQSIVVDEKCTSPFLRRSVRVSMGNIFLQNIRKTMNLKDDLIKLKNKGVSLIALSLPDLSLLSKSFILPEFTFPKDFAILLGNEANGLSPELKSICDFIVTIPMKGTVDSLNVSHSLASLLGFRLAFHK
jgi:tRNA G18 (ribose-2'-O)-methylase SpoU